MQGIASIGFNPTVENSDVAKLEVNIFDFDKNIYDERLVVSFIRKIRDEIKFPDLESMKHQMALDIDRPGNHCKVCKLHQCSETVKPWIVRIYREIIQFVGLIHYFRVNSSGRSGE